MSADPDARELTIAAEVPIAVRDYGGRGTDVLLLPGGQRTMDDWRQVVPLLLDAGLRVTAMDPRSHGRSGSGPWRWPEVIDDVSAVVDGLGLLRPAIVGHSLGGAVAVLWAAAHSDCSLAVNGDGHLLPKGPHQFAGLDPEAAAAAHATILDYRARALGAQPDPFVVELDAALDELDLMGVYRTVHCPVLVVFGQYPDIERLLPPSVAAAVTAYNAGVRRDLAALAAGNPLISLASVPGNHSIHLDCPREFTELVLQHLDRGRRQAS